MGVLKFRTGGGWTPMPVVRGPKGDIGPATELEIGAVETLSSSTPAYATVERPDPENPARAVLSLGIPRGRDAEVPFYVSDVVDGYQETGSLAVTSAVLYAKPLASGPYLSSSEIRLTATVSWTRSKYTGEFASATLVVSDAAALASGSPHTSDSAAQWEGTYEFTRENPRIAVGPAHGLSGDAGVYVDFVMLCAADAEVAGRTWNAGTILFGYADAASLYPRMVFASVSPGYGTLRYQLDTGVERLVDQAPTEGNHSSLVTSAGVANAVERARTDVQGYFDARLAEFSAAKVSKSELPDLERTVSGIAGSLAYYAPPTMLTMDGWTPNAFAESSGIARLVVSSTPSAPVRMNLPYAPSDGGTLLDLVVFVRAGATASIEVSADELTFAAVKSGSTFALAPLNGYTRSVAGSHSLRFMQLGPGLYLVDDWS